MSRPPPTRLTDKDFIVIWISGFTGAFLSYVLEHVIPEIKCETSWVTSLIPAEYCLVWEWALALVEFFVFCGIVIGLLLAILHLLRIVRWV